MRSPTRIGSLLVLTLTVVACSDITNEGPRKLQIHDLSRYALSTAPSLTEAPFYMTQVLGTRPAPIGDWIFVTSDGLWSTRGGEWVPTLGKAAPLQLTRVDAAGAVAETKTIDMSSYGYEGYSFVSGVTVDDRGLLWVAFNVSSYTDLVGISLATDEVVRTLAAPHSYGQHVIPLEYADGLIYVATPTYSAADSLLAIDATTGAIVQDYRDTVLATLTSLGSGLSNGWAAERPAIAVADDTLLVRGGDMQGSIFDVATGAHLGILGDVPSGAITGDDTVFLGVDSVGEAEEFVPSADPVTGFALENVLTFDRTGAHSITVSRDLIWVFYSSGRDEGDLIAYDPATFEAVEGFALDPETLLGIFDPDKGAGSYWLFGLAATDEAFYFQSASGENFYFGNGESGFHVVDYETGELDAVFSIPNISATSVCHDGTSLWLLEMRSENQTSLTGPTLHALDPSNGLRQSTFVGPVTTTGYAGLACTDNGLLYSGDESRLWVETSLGGSGSPTLNAMPLQSAGVSVVALDDSLWMLDRERNLLIVASTQ